MHTELGENSDNGMQEVLNEVDGGRLGERDKGEAGCEQREQETILGSL